MAWQKVNLNHQVRYKTTEKGDAILAEADEGFRKMAGRLPYRAPKDEEGYRKTQLWALMETFGPHITIGMNIPIDTEILVEVEEAKP